MLDAECVRRDDESMSDELHFPQVCHIKIIADADEGMIRASIELALTDHETLTELLPGHSSTGGKYVTYNVDVRVHSKAAMDTLDLSLRMIPGVRFIL